MTTSFALARCASLSSPDDEDPRLVGGLCHALGLGDNRLAGYDRDAVEAGACRTGNGLRPDRGQIDPSILARLRCLDQYAPAGANSPLATQLRYLRQHLVGALRR